MKVTNFDTTQMKTDLETELLNVETAIDIQSTDLKTLKRKATDIKNRLLALEHIEKELIEKATK